MYQHESPGRTNRGVSAVLAYRKRRADVGEGQGRLRQSQGRRRGSKRQGPGGKGKAQGEKARPRKGTSKYRKDEGKQQRGIAGHCRTVARHDFGQEGCEYRDTPALCRRLLLARGRVHWYSNGLGHGFIEAEDGGLMASVRREDIGAREEKILENNDEVSFEVVQGAEGPEARNVSRV